MIGLGAKGRRAGGSTMTKPAQGALALFLAVAAAAAFAQAAQADPSPFDGDWDVQLSCPPTQDGRAMAFSFEFAAKVKDGVLHGERGDAGQPGWMQLDGPINPDGTAALIAEGLTNLPSYALYGVQKGTHYKHPVQAKFERAHGTGSWTTIRTCTFAFDRR
jgi:hypothetical protein